METNFEPIKEEILHRAKDAHACKGQYTRAFKSKTLRELCAVIKDNFLWVCGTNVIDSKLLMQYHEEFAANDIYINTSVRSGYLLCDNATVKACSSANVVAYGNANVETYDNATVVAWGNTTVKAYDNATVVARGNATIVAWGNANVETYGNATVVARDNATVKAYDNTTVVARDNATVKAYDNTTVKAYDNATVVARGNATIVAWDNVYCTSYSMVGCKLNGNAIYGVLSTNTIYYASDDLKLVKQNQAD